MSLKNVYAHITIVTVKLENISFTPEDLLVPLPAESRP